MYSVYRENYTFEGVEKEKLLNKDILGNIRKPYINFKTSLHHFEH